MDKTQSTRFEVLVSNQNKGKTFDDVELDTNPQTISLFGNLHTLMEPEEEILEFVDDKILVAGDDMDTDTRKDTKESYHHSEHSHAPSQQTDSDEHPESPPPTDPNTSQSSDHHSTSSSLGFCDIDDVKLVT